MSISKFRMKMTDIVPLNLIQSPINQLGLLVWLVAFAQFCHFALTSMGSATIYEMANWLTTIPFLMLLSFFISIKLQMFWPVFIAFISGALGILYIGDTLYLELTSQHQNTGFVRSQLILLTIAIYSIAFRFATQAFLSCSITKKLQRLFLVELSPSFSNQFMMFLHYVSFLIINICLLLSFMDALPNIALKTQVIILMMAYLFLLLRITNVFIIPWLITIFTSWLFLIVQTPLNPQSYLPNHFSIIADNNIYSMGLYSLFYAIALIFASWLWDKKLNLFFKKHGWLAVSFKQPVMLTSFVIALFWLLVNLILLFGLQTQWFDLVKTGWQIESTTVYVFFVFFMLFLLTNKRVIAQGLSISLVVFLAIHLDIHFRLPDYALWTVVTVILLSLLLAVKQLSMFSASPKLQQLLQHIQPWYYLSQILVLIMFLVDLETYHRIRSWHLPLCSFIVFFSALIQYYYFQQKTSLFFTWLSGLVVIVLSRFFIVEQSAINVFQFYHFDTVVVFSLSALLFWLNRKGHLKAPLIRTELLVNLLPMTALFTLPWSGNSYTDSIHVSLSLLIIALFYLFQKSHNHFHTSAGFILLNLSIYHWVPLVSDLTHMLMVYSLPLSLSLLFISSLHKNDIKPQMYFKIRFFAFALLYCLLIADIFITESLFVFTLGLLLALITIIYAISTRNKAFLYSATLFLIIAILGQLFMLYPDGRLQRALVLMAMGTFITTSMIIFTIKRAQLLEKIRIIRSDLDSWE